MSGLTVTEKQHWKDRIARRIAKRIETPAAADPNLMDRIQREARQGALKSLGLAAWQTELHEIEQQKEALNKREQRIERSMLAQVRGVPLDSIDEYSGYRHTDEVERAVKRRQVVHEDELLADNPTGQQILAMRHEKENLLDTVWLATCSGELKTLWSKVTELLQDQPTQLERDALGIQPPAA